MKPLVGLLLLVLLTSCSSLDANAKIDVMRAEPTATAAALANQERAIYVATVVPAQAAADAASITARTTQQIAEDAHRQALQNAGEMAALTISNTQRLNEQTEQHEQAMQSIDARGAAIVTGYQADAQRTAATAWRDTGIAVALSIAIAIALCGVAWGVVVWFGNRAKIITHPSVGLMIITRSYIALPARSGGPLMMIRNDGAIFPIGPDQRAVTARAQQWTMLATAMRNGATTEQAVRMIERQADATPLQPPEPAVALPPAQVIPTFVDLIQSWRPSQQRLLFALDGQAQPIYGSLDQMLSGIIVGRQGQGKTTLLRMVYAQCALAGVQILTWDLHDDITAALPGVRAYTTLDTIKNSARDLIAEFDKRQRLHLLHDRAQPIMVLIDEVNRLAGLLPDVVEAIERFVAEGRKYQMFCFVTAKGAPSTLFAHRWVRDSFSTRWVFNTSATEARTVGIEAETARLAPNLPIGHALLDGPIAPAMVTIPNITPEDVRALLPISSPFQAPSAHFREGAEGQPGRGDGSGPEAAAEGERKRELVKQFMNQGKTNSEIIRQVWGVTSGRRYQQAAVELQQMIREMIQ